MSTYRFSTMTIVGALALVVSALSANAAQPRDGRSEKGTGEQVWNGNGRGDVSTNTTRRGNAENHRGGTAVVVPKTPRVTPPSKPVVVVKQNDGWRDGNGARGSDQSYQVRRYNSRGARYHHHRFDGPQAFEQHGGYRQSPRHRRHWWSRYW